MSKSRTINRGNKDFSGQAIGFGFLIFPLFHVCFSRSLFGTHILTLFSRFYMRWSFFVHFLSSVPCIVFCHLMKRLWIWSNFHLLKFAVQLFPRKVRCQNLPRVRCTLPRIKTATLIQSGASLFVFSEGAQSIQSIHCSASRSPHTCWTKIPLLSYMRKYGLPQ